MSAWFSHCGAVCKPYLMSKSPDFWLNLQKRFELRIAELELGAKLKAIKPIAKAG